MSDYTIIKAEEVPDPTGDNPGEMRLLTGPIGSEQVAFTYRRMPARSSYHGLGRESHGHSHKTQEAIYFVISGELQFKLGDEVVDVRPKTAVRVGPSMTRSIRNEGSDEAELVICSVKVEDLRAEAELHEGFWPE